MALVVQDAIKEALYSAAEDIGRTVTKRAASAMGGYITGYGKRARSYVGGYAPRKSSAAARYFKARGGFTPKQMSNRRSGGFVGQELKFVDSEESIATSSITPAGAEADNSTMLCLNGIAQGDGENQRDGREVVLKSVQVKGVLSIPTGTALNTSGPAFVALLWDSQTNAAQFNAEDVYEQPLASNTTGVFRNLEHTGRFRVLGTRIVKMNVQAAAGDGTANDVVQYVGRFSMFKKLNNIPVRYTGTGATVANITDNSLHLMVITSSTTHNINWASRVRFCG